jgi:hypothetical protein
MISIHIILKQVARVKSTARPMTSEELAVAGVPPTGIEIRESENIQSRVDVPVFDVVPDFGSQEEGEIGSGSKSGGEEHLSNVEADPRELIAMKSVKSYPPTFVFGESKVTTVVIQEYEENRFFLLVPHDLLLASKSLLLDRMKWSFSEISLPAGSDSRATLLFPLFLISSQ